MKCYLLLIMCALFISLAIGCSADKEGSNESPPKNNASETTDTGITSGINDAKAKLKKSIDLAIAKYRTDLIVNIMQLFRHSIWVIGDEASIQKALNLNGLQMVDGLIRGDDHPSSSHDIWGVESPPMSGGQAYVAMDSDSIFVVFRSTNAEDGWDLTLNVLTDLKAYHSDVSFLNDMNDMDLETNKHGTLRVHSGFQNEYLRYRESILDRLAKHPDKDVYVTGHSLGGGLAVLNGFDIAAHTGRDVTLITFGQPRVGNSAFRKMSDELIPNTYRIVMDGDPVSRIPGSLLDYEHTGKLLQINDSGSQVPPKDLQTGTLFNPVDFPMHYLKTYYDGLLPLLESCVTAQNSSAIESCIDLTWLVTSAETERSASKKAWDILPEGSPPWENLEMSTLPIEAPDLPNLKKNLAEFNLPELKALKGIDEMIIDGVSLDKLPIDKLPMEDMNLDSLLPDLLPFEKPDLKGLLK
ncbi:MAG: lipase family protein [Chloroflexota bacterium]|nr:lipase family protein [Chloroflexota bacterium]